MQRRPKSEVQDRKGYLSLPATMDKRSAVGSKFGEMVRQSVPGLRRPTPPSTTGRKPAARPSFSSYSATVSRDSIQPRVAGSTQRIASRNAEQSPAVLSRCEAPVSYSPSAGAGSYITSTLDDSDIAAFIEFFEILNRWDREYRALPKIFGNEDNSQIGV
jgi:hypothetical protein